MTLPLSGKKVVDKGLLDVGGAAEDVGEVVPRARDILGPGGRLDSNTSSKLIPGSIGASKEPKRKARDERTAPKKKNRKENTIDDLFKGVL